METDDIKTQYDSLGEGYAENQAAFFENQRDFAREFIASHLRDPQGKTLIDVGCGSGIDVERYEKMPFKSVFGIDPSNTMIAMAKARVAYPDNVRIGEFEKTGFTDSSFDYVTSRFALHYLEEFSAAYYEMYRILKPGGVMALSVDHPTASAIGGKKFKVGTKTYVTIEKLYGKNVDIKFPLHIFTDYFSPTLLRLFEIIAIEERIGKDLEYQDGPNSLFFAVKSRKLP